MGEQRPQSRTPCRDRFGFRGETFLSRDRVPVAVETKSSREVKHSPFIFRLRTSRRSAKR